MSMTADEAAAVALAFSMLREAAAVDHEGRPLQGRLPRLRVDDPRAWSDFARREALMIDADVP